MIPEVVVSRVNLMRFLSNDNEFEIEKTYSFNNVIFGPVFKGNVQIEFPNGLCGDMLISRIDEKWLSQN